MYLKARTKNILVQKASQEFIFFCDSNNTKAIFKKKKTSKMLLKTFHGSMSQLLIVYVN